eukprot:CAMPEP_0177644236 /NCGR_PEP_ID=MMETSP0447-20121125/8577_1 /TAXON_ID=0 /ORGANISM="Stygamoeba regulata, Strain BSH-02190019" /LENGTH=1120 /DNA_ID=CAMNT_0019146577 /DNA_START=437 /DNA_END=3799 /DNA_ORIENTATION=+
MSRSVREAATLTRKGSGTDVNRWSDERHGKHIHVVHNSTEGKNVVLFQVPSSGKIKHRCAQASVPFMESIADMQYFEVKILDVDGGLGKGDFSIGLTPKDFVLEGQAAGSKRHTHGLVVSDGKGVIGGAAGRDSASAMVRVGVGDTLGCGIMAGTVFYTHNGELVGLGGRLEPHTVLLPTVSLDRRGRVKGEFQTNNFLAQLTPLAVAVKREMKALGVGSGAGPQKSHKKSFSKVSLRDAKMSPHDMDMLKGLDISGMPSPEPEPREKPHGRSRAISVGRFEESTVLPPSPPVTARAEDGGKRKVGTRLLDLVTPLLSHKRRTSTSTQNSPRGDISSLSLSVECASPLGGSIELSPGPLRGAQMAALESSTPTKSGSPKRPERPAGSRGSPQLVQSEADQRRQSGSRILDLQRDHAPLPGTGRRMSNPDKRALPSPTSSLRGSATLLAMPELYSDSSQESVTRRTGSFAHASDGLDDSGSMGSPKMDRLAFKLVKKKPDFLGGNKALRIGNDLRCTLPSSAIQGAAALLKPEEKKIIMNSAIRRPGLQRSKSEVILSYWDICPDKGDELMGGKKSFFSTIPGSSSNESTKAGLDGSSLGSSNPACQPSREEGVDKMRMAMMLNNVSTSMSPKTAARGDMGHRPKGSSLSHFQNFMSTTDTIHVGFDYNASAFMDGMLRQSLGVGRNHASNDWTSSFDEGLSLSIENQIRMYSLSDGSDMIRGGSSAAIVTMIATWLSNRDNKQQHKVGVQSAIALICCHERVMPSTDLMLLITRTYMKRDGKHSEGCIAMLTLWLQHYSGDFVDVKGNPTELHHRLREFTQALVADYRGGELPAACAALVANTASVVAAPSGENKPINTTCVLAGDGKMLRQHFDFIDLHPREVAVQLTRIDHEFFQSVPRHELVARQWTLRDSACQRLINRFNRLSGWAASEILTTPSVKQRVEVLKRFILCASFCWELHNINGMMAIVSALGCHPVARLKKTWKLVSPKYVSMLQRLESHIRFQDNVKEYRRLQRQCLQSGEFFLPMFAVITRDLTFIYDGNTDHLDDMHTINFDKIYLAGCLIHDAIQLQHVPFVYPETTVRAEKVYKYLQRLANTFSDDILYEMSLRLEPRSVDLV